jgi:hypothetical protein
MPRSKAWEKNTSGPDDLTSQLHAERGRSRRDAICRDIHNASLPWLSLRQKAMIRRLALCVHQVSKCGRSSTIVRALKPRLQRGQKGCRAITLAASRGQSRGWSAVNNRFVVPVDGATPVNIWNNQSAHMKRRSAPPSNTCVPCLADSSGFA